MLRWHVVSAVFWRNVKQYFSGPLGYLFIVMFVTVCAVMTFSPQFFADNLANLDQLSHYFPMLLLFFIPAITMTVWAEEKRQGTDSILFTLPASDLDILLGKFFSVVAVYTIALLFSLTQVLVLGYLGNPDWGVVLTTYIGYWLAGVALLSVGMFASSFTESATVAFVMGAVLCAVPVLIGQYFQGLIGLERFGFDWNLRDFTLGIVPLSNTVYFLALTVFMLYLNLVVISKRRWSRGQEITMAGQYLIRTLALGVALIAFAVLSNTAVSSIWSRVDMTRENLYTLDPVTVETLEKIKADKRQVTVQAFISKDVPRQYVNVKKQFIGLLRQYSEFGGGNVNVRFVDVEPNSDQAINAKLSGIEPEADRSVVGGKTIEQDVYLGARISTSIDDAVLPFVDDDSALEYELSRSLASTIDKDNKITIGLLDTDAFFGGPEFQGRRVPWSYNTTLDELKKQFKIKYISARSLDSYLPSQGTPEGELAEPPKEAPDVLLVADPSSLDDPSMDNLVRYVEQGHPTLLLTDPLPFFWAFQDPRQLGVLNAPKMDRVSSRSPYAQILTSSPMPKSDNGSASKIMNAIGVEWDSGAAAWSLDNPHPNFAGAVPAFMGGRWMPLYGPYQKAFVWARNHGDVAAFNPNSAISAGLNETLMFYPGSYRKVESADLEFTPLVSLGVQSGSTPWDELTLTPQQEQRFLDPRTGKITSEKTPAVSQITMSDLVVLDPDSPTLLDDQDHVLAARIRGTGDRKLDVVLIADLDFVSDVFYTQQKELDQPLDNLALLQNAIEVLSGNESFVRLRNRRPQPRTLTRLEDVISSYREKTAREREMAETQTEAELKVEQDKLNAANQEIQSDQNMGFFEKLQKTSQQAMDAQRRFELKQQRLDKELKTRLDSLKTDEQQKITNLESRTRFWSILVAPLPALFLGVIVLWARKVTEERGIASDRRV